MIEERAPREEYEVMCHCCRSRFEASQAPWCNCVTSSRTLVCPNCLRCFCRAPRRYKNDFWTNAPDRLWQRKFAEKNVPAEPAGSPPDPLDVKRPLVLIADDEPAVLGLAAAAVRSLGYTVIVAHDGEELIERARGYRPDLVLTDALMPKGDGREICRMLKDDTATCDIKVVVMTSVYATGKYRGEAVSKFHVDGFLTKPIERTELRELLTLHLGG